MSVYKKYGRTLHAQISLGATKDDKTMPGGYVKAFAQMEGLILTEKLDGQNNCFNKNGVFARSHSAPTEHPWDKPLIDRWKLIRNDLGNLEIFGENMYAVHSITYKKLESYFYVFAARESDQWLSWDEVKFYAEMLDFPTVPEIPVKTQLNEIFEETGDENVLLERWLKENLGISWEESVKTQGLLGGCDTETGLVCSEGFVVRNMNGFKANDGIIPVAGNEFNNLFKLVRPSHVKTSVHWTKKWKPAVLIDYAKFKWNEYEFMRKIEDKRPT